MIKTEQRIPTIPGRGLVTVVATKLRLEYLQSLSICTSEIEKSHLDIKTVQKNIESFIGTVEIPLGIVGPLLFVDGEKQELVYTAAGTLEGALIASMNRGARAISHAGGFTAEVLWQKMCRAPMFIFDTVRNAHAFATFVESHYADIKQQAEKYSNHARLLELDCIRDEQVVHVKFFYTTGDASGQNMTTTCTWHAMLYLVQQCKEQTGIRPVDFVIEGNGSSDKKISRYNMTHGRGMNVTATCFLPEQIITEILRTTSEKIEQCYLPSRTLAHQDGMVGYNINVANTVAAIYAATGQDLACIHESSTGELTLRRADGGLYLTLNLPNLVIGTVGGGTHLAKQAEALRIMNCLGTGTVTRFAKLIAGFALSLEISTYAAIVSGAFAKAHEKLGRNKPVNWLLRSEITEQFLRMVLNECNEEILSVNLDQIHVLENGILTNIAGTISKKMIGFETLRITYRYEGTLIEKPLMLKSKALDTEVIKGLHRVAASIDPELSDLFYKYQDHLEYKHCHRKEPEIYSFLHRNMFTNIPRVFGTLKDEAREIYMIALELLDPCSMAIMNSENSPEQWTSSHVMDAIRVIDTAHKLFTANGLTDMQLRSHVHTFEPWNANELYNKLLSLLIREEKSIERKVQLEELIDAAARLEILGGEILVRKTIIHNDYNPRNVAVSNTKNVNIYDWELAMLNFPHRDVVEFLSFVLPEDFSTEELFDYLEFHYHLNIDRIPSREEWFKVYTYSVTEYIITRVTLYEVAGIVVKYDFSKRILTTALRMLTMLKSSG